MQHSKISARMTESCGLSARMRQQWGISDDFVFIETMPRNTVVHFIFYRFLPKILQTIIKTAHTFVNPGKPKSTAFERPRAVNGFQGCLSDSNLLDTKSSFQARLSWWAGDPAAQALPRPTQRLHRQKGIQCAHQPVTGCWRFLSSIIQTSRDAWTR